MYIKMTEQDKVDPIKLKALKLRLPHGTISQIARELSLSRESVNKVFDGKWENDQVLDMAIEILENRKGKTAHTEKRIDQVLSN